MRPTCCDNYGVLASLGFGHAIAGWGSMMISLWLIGGLIMLSPPCGPSASSANTSANHPQLSYTLVPRISHDQSPPHENAIWQLRGIREEGVGRSSDVAPYGPRVPVWARRVEQDAPHEGRILTCGAAMLHTRLARNSPRAVWSIIAPHNAHRRREAKVWRAVSPHKTHTGIPAGVWSNIAPHKRQIPAWNRRVEHWRSTRHCSSACVEHRRSTRSTQPAAPNM